MNYYSPIPNLLVHEFCLIACENLFGNPQQVCWCGDWQQGRLLSIYEKNHWGTKNCGHPG